MFGNSSNRLLSFSLLKMSSGDYIVQVIRIINYLPDYSHIIAALSVIHTRSVCFVKAAKCILKENKSNINSACTNLREHYGTVGVILMPLLAHWKVTFSR